MPEKPVRTEQIFSLRPMHTRLEAALVAGLEGRCFPKGWSEAEYEHIIEDPHYKIFGLFSSTDLIAYLVCFYLDSALEILNFGTHPDYRRNGCGSRLLEHLIHVFGREKHICRIFLEVREGNWDALSLYARFNFKVTGRRKKYYANAEDALCLEWQNPLNHC